MSFLMNPDSALRIARQQVKEAHAARQQDRLAGLVPSQDRSSFESTALRAVGVVVASLPALRHLLASQDRAS